MLSRLSRCAIVAGFALFTFAGSSVQAQSRSNGGYIDSAVPENMMRLRADADYRINRADRAEFIYSKGFANHLDYQDISSYLEYAPCERFSGFVELHQHLVNPVFSGPNDNLDNAEGFGDMNLGLKYAFLHCDDHVASVQLRTYIPTGMPKFAFLGTGHVTINPSVLYNQRLTDQLTMEAEVQDYIPIGGSDFQGNVLRYGVGLGYTVFERERLRVTPVVEFVGWTVLSGKESVGQDANLVSIPKDAAGDTIVNGKLGMRVGLGAHSDFYFGYGRALTGDVWYKELYRVEYRLRF